jgi:hypothetical protein
MTIALDHVELTSVPTPVLGEPTLLRYWQAPIPGTDLYAVTEEGFTRTGEPGEGAAYVHITQFFVCETPANEQGPAGPIVIRDDTYNYGNGPIGKAIEALTGPTSWDDAPRQRMLAEALDRAAQNA